MRTEQTSKNDNHSANNKSIISGNHTHNRLLDSGNSIPGSEPTAAIIDTVTEIPLRNTSFLVIGCGDSGGHAVSDFKSQAPALERFDFLVIDSDAQTQQGADTGVPFEVSEFLLLNRRPDKTMTHLNFEDALSCNSERIRRGIEEKISALNDWHNTSNACLQNRIIVFIVSSTCRGTGARIELQVSSIVRDIVSGQDGEVDIIRVFPERFENVVRYAI